MGTDMEYPLLPYSRSYLFSWQTQRDSQEFIKLKIDFLVGEMLGLTVNGQPLTVNIKQ
ncbi:MAG: hypothetical protein F6K26_04990 [Moorea sp. SIO2I5]|nr:hypothetical protein [Moorena sp. SIO2I5]